MRSRTAAKLLPISKQEVEATLAGDRPKRKFKAQYKPLARKRRKEVGTMTKVLIEEGTRVRKLLGPTGIGAVGTVRPVTALDSSGMSVITWQEQHAE